MMSDSCDEEKKGLNVLVAGCIHGYWDNLVNAVEHEIENGNRIDVVLVNGDNQTFRTKEDMESSSHYVQIKENKPDRFGKKPKYSLDEYYGSFHKYVNPSTPLPCLFILIGGNNECEDLLCQMPYGGFIADNLYYAGRSSILDYKGLRISTLSGIFNESIFNQLLFEKFPIRNGDIKTNHYIRSFSLYQLLCYGYIPKAPKINVMMTHDWPNDERGENRFKNIIIDCPEEKKFPDGNKYAPEILCSLKPDYWTAAHLHTKFEAEYYYDNVSTKFIASPRANMSDFYSIIHFDYDELNPETRDSNVLSYAPEWIAILQSTKDARSIPKEFHEFKWSRIKERKYQIIKNLEDVKLKVASNPSFLEVQYEIDPKKATQLICKQYNIYSPPRGKRYYTNHKKEEKKDVQYNDVIQEKSYSPIQFSKCRRFNFKSKSRFR